MIIRIYCNILLLLTEWSFCYWNAQFYLHIEHLNKKATMPECPFLLIISCVVRKWDQDKKKRGVIDDKMKNILLRSG